MSAEWSGLPADGAPVPPATLRSSLIDRGGKEIEELFCGAIAGVGDHRRYENDNTRMAYYRAVCSFFAWLEQHGLGELPDIEPFHVAAYLKALRVSDAGGGTIRERTASRPTVKQHLAAIRMLFDWLVVGQVLAIHPAHAVRGPKHVVKRGKTPVLSEEQARLCSRASRWPESSPCPTARKPKCRRSSGCATGR